MAQQLRDLTAQQEPRDQIRSVRCDRCYMCGVEGELLYQDLRDRYFNAAGIWHMKKCRICGLVWLDPIPAKEDIGKAYETYYTHSEPVATRDGVGQRLKQRVRMGYFAHKYGYRSGGARLFGFLTYLSPFRRAGLDFSVMYVPNVPGGRLLEVGCGSGYMLNLMAELGWQAEGVDFDSAAVEKGTRRGLKIHRGLLEDIGFDDNCFDTITMSHVIEHVHEPLDLLKECRRILKPGGRLSLVTPNIDSLGHRLYTSSWFHLDPPRHLRIFSVGSITALLRKAGFHTVEVGTTIRGAAGAHLASRSIRRSGRYEWCSKPTRGSQFWASVIQTIQWLLLAARPRMGEEIAAIAEK